MKANFVLTSSTVSLFIHRLNSLISKTGMLETLSKTTGRKAVRSMLLSQGVESHWILPIVEHAPGFLDKDRIQYDSYPGGYKIGTKEGLIVRFNTDSCHVFYWGQKMKFTPNKIIFLGMSKMEKSRKLGYNLEYKISNRISFGKAENAFEEKYAADYWKSVEEEYENEYRKELEPVLESWHLESDF